MPNPAYFRRRLCHRPASIPNVELSAVSDARIACPRIIVPLHFWSELP
jgi:hypothetical protein